jgi:hypothetical protein
MIMKKFSPSDKNHVRQTIEVFPMLIEIYFVSKKVLSNIASIHLIKYTKFFLD